MTWGIFLSVTALPLSANKTTSPLRTRVHSVHESLPPSPSMQQVVSVWVRDPRIQKNDFWHAYIDYEVCLHVSKKKWGEWCFNPCD